MELLVVIGVVGLLMSILLSTVGGVLGAARSVRCQTTQRDVVLAFQQFASEELNEGRGDDRRLGRRFRLATFQDAQYDVDEFWAWGSAEEHTLADPTEGDHMRCAEVGGSITLRRNIECMDGAITPSQNMSYGFNRRLHREEYTDSRGRVRTRQAYLTEQVLQARNVPLLWDVNAEVAAAKFIYPGFSAPSLDSHGAYAHERFWHPAARHNGGTNVAFIDGHVEHEKDLLSQSSWNWSYQFGVRP